ncbi:MAG TPA: tRNA uridine-5-carboxymethylaminomethyl(34) synthesis GTPase MnmE [Candidatus Krumholzibacteriaceae bacterium]|nr:tRNA uridine-5-carboxymethylaminomethyl(34) synthesis GTPase MnmE [Candidatus Krumholzibacteriaceae bacterium]
MGEKTIVALSTPPGESAIAVIRISGNEAVNIADEMIEGPALSESHHLYNRIIKDHNGQPIDDVAAVLMRGPYSYTGEDVVEIFCHGSMHVVSALIDEAMWLGAEVAPPGEFTKRAFLNGKIDLAQAEAVADLISSETRLQSSVALKHLRGGLSEKVRSIEKELLRQLSLVEVSIDFSTEDIETYSADELARKAEWITKELEELISSRAAGGKLRNGIKITLTGPRNAGKSSIYNTLLGEERAIVSHIAGTTRDILRERIHIGGFTYYLEDTAGIAEAEGEIEAKGISVGIEAAAAADMVVFVIDGSVEHEESLYELALRLKNRRHIIAINKKDLGLKIKKEDVRKLTEAENVIEISALTSAGFGELKKWIYKNTVSSEAGRVARDKIAVNSRQAMALTKALQAIKRMKKDLEAGQPAEILSVEIREAAAACGEITGRSIEEDLLDNIFSTFCVGK